MPDLASTYFALRQLPIYLSPYLLQPLARRLVERRAKSADAGDMGKT